MDKKTITAFIDLLSPEVLDESRIEVVTIDGDKAVLDIDYSISGKEFALELFVESEANEGCHLLIPDYIRSQFSNILRETIDTN